jgi:hypothetical protein
LGLGFGPSGLVRRVYLNPESSGNWQEENRRKTTKQNFCLPALVLPIGGSYRECSRRSWRYSGHGSHTWYQRQVSGRCWAAITGVVNTAPVTKPSMQTHFVLEAMADRDRETQESLSKVMETLVVVSDRLKDVERVQQQMMMRKDLAASVAEQAAKERVEVCRKVEEIGKVVAQIRLEMMGKQLEDSSRGAEFPSSAHQHHNEPPGFRGRQEHVESRGEFRGGPSIPSDDVHQHSDNSHQVLPKLPFPRFADGDPVVWLDKCLEYFSVYQVPPSMWVSVASMNLENIVAQWWHCHKLKYGLGGWHEFGAAVVSKFGAEAYPRALRRLFSLCQFGTLDNYVHEFEQARYGVAVHNAQYDETFFVTHFVCGLKFELQDVVQVQVPTTVDRAILLAQIQQEVLDRGRGKGQRQLPYLKEQQALPKGDDKGQQCADLTQERQLRDFRRLNGLCYACGERFEPGHIAKCAKRGSAQLNAVVNEEVSKILTDEILHHLEKEDQSGELCCHLSFQAVSGTCNDYSMRVRSIVGKQTMLMLGVPSILLVNIWCKS